MGLSIIGVTINCRDPRSLAEWWAETLDEGEITHDLGEYVFVRAGRIELGFQGVAAEARERIRLHLDLEADDPEAEVRRLVDRGAVVVEQHEVALLGMAWTVLHDPEGNDFCVSARGTTIPASAPQVTGQCSAAHRAGVADGPVRRDGWFYGAELRGRCGRSRYA